MSAGDRDTLTDAEIGLLHLAIVRNSRRDLFSVIESIVAARIRAAKAQAWDEGHYTGMMDCSRYRGAVEANRHPRPTDTPNPYRLDAGDEFQNPED